MPQKYQILFHGESSGPSDRMRSATISASLNGVPLGTAIGRVEELVKAAVGFNAGRGDAVKVINVPFVRDTALAGEGKAGLFSFDDVAAATLFLASDAGSFITGQQIAIDGGTSITDGS